MRVGLYPSTHLEDAMSRLTPALVALALSGCVADEGLGESEQHFTSCPKWGCGENTPVIGPYDFHELNVDGLPNLEDIRVLDFQKGTTHYLPKMINGTELRAIDPQSGASIGGTDLINGFFNVLTPTGPYKIIIAHVNPAQVSGVTYWVGPANGIERTIEIVASARWKISSLALSLAVSP